MSLLGSFWGGGSDAAGALWLRINRDVPYFTALGDVIETFASKSAGVLDQIESAFDLDTAVGYSLDLWGGWLGVLRLGLGDDDYRRLLQVQAAAVLIGRSTRAKMIRVFEIWTGAAALEYRGDGRTVEIGGDAPTATEYRLLALLRRIVPGGRRVVAYSLDADSLVADYGLDPTGTTTITDYGLDPVTDPALTAERIQ